ncbi:hypothetical protein F751_1167 [Auxenochlorella protothecoides]|uniref:Uncharacterized protein n=1 Tax=Auxenochlorella protothecoides TaxID=3075 RepID=A0A087SNT6_AUXPR|nr:hypothetical protein F751_1167 [Auxenochlorella protothecoides]KFM27390.1 hypothetical protein F751_1167 [Auxenochlorella protothecoides]RMZ54145.1 hypothetical protein APUTEX25_005301 [Auxenochlorella protothecoides]|eukprot:RMZ54145.1 hypothetical protein APUTEX25_005301 [Auxenochlorella protothecoides]
MTQAMGLKVAELAPAEQVQLMHSVLTTWQVRLARTHGQAMVRQGEEANELRTGSLGVARAEARRRALVAVDRQLEAGLAAYRAAAADTLVFGLVALGRLQAGRVRERARAALERDLEVAPPGSGLGGLTAALCLLQGVLLPATISWFTFYSLETGLEWGWW